MTRRIACIAMTDRNHFSGILPIIHELVRAGASVRMWTDRAFRSKIESAGAEFEDLFDPVAVEEVDDASRPLPSRFVTFAGVCGADVAERVGRWRPDLILCGSFAYVGQVVAKRLSLPHAIVASGHAELGAAFRARQAASPRVQTDPRCLAAVERIRTEFGMPDAGPMSYIADPSPWLTVYREPEEWLSKEERAVFGPLAFFGSLSESALEAATSPQATDGTLQIYAGLGTIIWRYWSREALELLAAIGDAVSQIPRARLTIGLGGARLSLEDLTRLRHTNVESQPLADQWSELGRSHLFICHHGLASTHEAVARGVPMLSYPIFWDQPAEALRAQEFGIALPLADSGPLGAVTPRDVAAAIDGAMAQRAHMLERLSQAREWERRTIAGRPEVARQVIATGG